MAGDESTGNGTEVLRAFGWTPQPVAEVLVQKLVRDFKARCPAAGELEERLRNQTGTRLADWIDSIDLGDHSLPVEKLFAAGFTPVSEGVFVQNMGIFPRIVRREGAAVGPMRMMLRVEDVADYLAAEALVHPAATVPRIEGPPLGRLRRARVARGDDAELWVVERHGYAGFAPPSDTTERGMAARECLEAFRRRPRKFADEAQGFSALHQLIEAALRQLDNDVDRVADLFFASEREYWQRRNRAAQIQKLRQDALGLGWGNHDHHTYRSSRRWFAALIGVLEKLGCQCRERFYAGAQARWGAQVLEQTGAGVVIFADVDLSDRELTGDFSHQGLAPQRELGTVGLWCGLHGEAILQAGLHHLECRFDFASLKAQLEKSAGIQVMNPFTDLPYLKQAFTQGEIWPVEAQRVDRLLGEGRITPEQARQFKEHGALGSHLENLQRDQGFKGFNQSGVSQIIAATDPRK